MQRRYIKHGSTDTIVTFDSKPERPDIDFVLKAIETIQGNDSKILENITFSFINCPKKKTTRH